MILVFGGSYNGKCQYIKNKYDIREEEIFFCNAENINFNKKVINGLHIFIRSCVLKNIDSFALIEKNKENFKDKIIICDEINSGIVPMNKEDRIWREECGQVMQLLMEECDEAYRVFFGIGEKVK